MPVSRAQRKPISVLADFIELSVMTPPEVVDFIFGICSDVTPHMSTEEVERLRNVARRLVIACDLTLQDRQQQLH